MPTILVVDDERDMQQLIEIMLKAQGFHVICVSSGEESYAMIGQEQIDLVLLDIMMPGENGFLVCETIRKIDTVPVIFLTALDSTEDKVHGLKIGGDDYIVKPFTGSELVARIEAVLRRTTSYISTVQQEQLSYGPISVDEDSRKVTVVNDSIVLTLKEYELLHLFMKHPNIVYSREQLLEKVWNSTYEGGTRTVDTHIKTLRIKLGKASAEAAQLIETVWGIGYRFGVQV
jgi:DNA-binding response OmpR family regulator